MSARDDSPGAPAPDQPAKPALKDRIADLKLGTRAKAVGASLAERMKSVHSAADAVRRDTFNRDAMKAGRDGLSAKVEALLKPRRPDDDPPLTVRPIDPEPRSLSTQALPPATPTVDSDGVGPTQRNARLQGLKARLENALRTGPATPPLPLQPVGDAPGAIEAAPSTIKPAPADAAALGTSGPARSSSADVSPPSMTKSTLEAGMVPTTPAASEVALETIPEPEVRTARTARTRAAAESERRRPLLSLGMITTALVAGGVLHILTVFTIPFVNTGSAFDRLRWDLERNVLRVLPSDQDGKTPLPFLSADMRYAMCRYDLSEGSVQVTALLPDIGWSLTLYTPQGDNFYAVPGQDGKPVTAAFSLNTASDRLLLPVPGMRRADTDAAQVTSPQREGLLVIRAPNRGPAYQPTLEDALRRARCTPAPRR